MHFAGQNMHKNIFKLNAAGSNPLIIQSTCIPSFNMNQTICKMLATLEDTILAFDQTWANQYDFLSFFDLCIFWNNGKKPNKSHHKINPSHNAVLKLLGTLFDEGLRYW